MISKPICNRCKHFCLNHDSGIGVGCRAFPNGIPKEAQLEHSSLINGQLGSFIYEPVAYDELPPFTKLLWDKDREDILG